MEDWAEVHRLFHREAASKAAIARRLGMSRNTVERLLSLREPPRYASTSQLAARPVRGADPGTPRGRPTARATVIRERLRAEGKRLLI